MKKTLREAHKRLADLQAHTREGSSPPHTAPKSGLATDVAALRQLRAAWRAPEPDRRAPNRRAAPPADAESSPGDEASELDVREHTGLGRGRAAFIDMVAWAEARIVDANLAAETAMHENARLRRLLARRDSDGQERGERAGARRSTSPALAHTPQQPRASSPYGAERSEGAELSRLRARVASLETELASVARAHAHAERGAHQRHASLGSIERSPLQPALLGDAASAAYGGGEPGGGGESFQTLRLLRLLQERDAELLRLHHDRALAAAARERTSAAMAARASAPLGDGVDEAAADGAPVLKSHHPRHVVQHRPPPPTPAATAARPRGSATPSTVGQMALSAPVTAGRLEPLPVLRELTRVHLPAGDEPAPVGLRALCTELQLQLGYVLDMLEAQTERSERLRSQHLYSAQARAADVSPSLSV